ncbi:MAG TPA: hypothetical protein PKU70_05910 [Vicinamibacteria bacterium]|nr:hypothetical protein [Vicinamibacteria bacterium]HRB12526.1 hypothetical protein [Vicinamibacteria bacterium]
MPNSLPGSRFFIAAFSVARLFAIVLAITISARSAEGQVCTGAAPFSSGHVRIGVGGGGIGAGFGGTAGDASAGVRLSFGATRGPFASVAASMVLYGSENPFVREGLAKRTTDDASADLVGVAGGYGISLSEARKIEFCPLAGLLRQSGPASYDNCSTPTGGNTICSGGVEGSGRVLWFGGNIGVLMTGSPTFGLVPFAGAAYVSSQISVGERNASDGYVEVTVGVGLVYRRVTIRPTLTFPVGLEHGEPQVGIEFALNLGHKS